MNNRTQQRARSDQRRKPPPQKRPGAVDVWRTPAPLPDFEPIAVPHDVSAMLRSLGDPPMYDGTQAAHYFVTVVERAAAVAVAIAVSADLLATADLA